MKVCSKCKNLFDESSFFSNKSTKDGLSSYCKTCICTANAQHRKDNKIIYYCANCNNILERKMKLMLCVECYSDHRKQYRRDFEKLKRQDISYRLKNNISRSVREALSLNGLIKKGRAITKYLPYSIEELKHHIESQFGSWMNWGNQGHYIKTNWNDNDPSTWKWQIDHIIPQSSFKYTSMEDQSFKVCWALSNLRPLSAKENLIKSNK